MLSAKHITDDRAGASPVQGPGSGDGFQTETLPKSGSIDREQGVSKAGNPRLRSAMIELAWLWTRHQPDSALSQWFRERAKLDTRRKVTIVALARKLLVALWKYVTAGVVIEGAVMKAAA